MQETGSLPVMARRRLLGVLALLGSATMLRGCGLFGGGSGYRFRMTVEVDTPQGLKSGSSVYEVIAYKSVALTSEEKPGGGGLRGQANVVDLPGGALFVLLKMPVAGEGLGEAATFAMRPETPRGNVTDYVAAVHALGRWGDGAKAELPRRDWPMMVRFGDVGDPTSVAEIDPETVGVRRILVETTTDSVTGGIEKRLSWLNTHVGTLVKRPRDMPIGQMTKTQRLTVLDFRKGATE